MLYTTLKIIAPLISMLIFVSIPYFIYLEILHKDKIKSVKFKTILKITVISALIFLTGSYFSFFIMLTNPNISEVGIVVHELIFPIGFFLIVYLENKKKHFLFFKDLLGDKNKEKRLKYSFKIVLLFFIFLSLLSYLKFFFSTIDLKREINIILMNRLFFILDTGVSILIAPLAEEFFFRGMVYQTFKEKGKLFALIMSSIMWALIHPFSVPAYISTIIFGIFLSYVYDKTGFIIVPISIHMIWNFWLSFGRVTRYLLSDRTDINPFNIYLIVLAILCAITLVVRKITLKRYLEG